MTIGIMGLGSSELIIVLIVLIALPILNSIIFYRMGKKAGYNQGKADALENKNKN